MADIIPEYGMDANQLWAIGAVVSNRFDFGHGKTAELPDPSILVQELSSNFISSFGSEEVYSDRLPVFVQAGAVDDICPIDVLYGRYDLHKRRIEIYFKAIERDKSRFGATNDDLLYIIRLHEYSHALVHLGVRRERQQANLELMDGQGSTDWQKFFEDRTKAFCDIDDSSHEYLAQAITLACILKLDEPVRVRLQTVFQSLESKQPMQYRLPPESLEALAGARWDIILDAVRRDFGHFRHNGFVLREALIALVLKTGSGQK